MATSRAAATGINEALLVASEHAVPALDRVTAALTATAGLRCNRVHRLRLSRPQIASIVSVHKPAATIADVGAWCADAAAEVAFMEVEHPDPHVNAIDALQRVWATHLLPLVTSHPATTAAPAGGYSGRDKPAFASSMRLTASLRSAVTGAAARADAPFPPLFAPADRDQCTRLDQLMTKYHDLAVRASAVGSGARLDETKATARGGGPLTGRGMVMDDWPPADAAIATHSMGLDTKGVERGDGEGDTWTAWHPHRRPPIPAPLDPFRQPRLVPNATECVDMDTLMAFVFPPGCLHPRSTGRLVLFALYGPLTPDAQLVGGRGGGRPLSHRELGAMIDGVEREDVCAVYTGGSVLCDVAGVEAEVHAPSLALPNLTRSQVEAMLIDLPRDAAGRLAFHDVQQRVLQARQARIDDLRRMFPAITSADRHPAILRKKFVPMQQIASVGTSTRGSVQRRLAATALAGSLLVGSGGGRASPPSEATAFAASAVNLGSMGLLAHVGGRHATAAATTDLGRGKPGTGAKAGPPLSRNGGGLGTKQAASMGPIQATRHREWLLHKGTSRVMELGDMHRPGAAASVAATLTMAREMDSPATRDVLSGVPPFNAMAPLGMHRSHGSSVPGSVYVGGGVA